MKINLNRGKGLFFALLVPLLFLGNSHSSELYPLERALEHLERAHTNDSPLYVSYELDFVQVKGLIGPIERIFHLKLKNRGEAHITLLTPAELTALKKWIAVDSIRSIFENGRVTASISILCLGVGEAPLNGKKEKTFFLVIESESLKAMRKRVALEAREKGMPAPDFDPNLYYPHITVGFTQEDLHYEQGVIKDRSACTKELILTSP